MEHEVIAEDDGVVRRVEVASATRSTRVSCWPCSSAGDGAANGAQADEAPTDLDELARRPRRRARAPRDRARRRPPRRRRQAPRARPPHRAREPRRPRRRGHVRRVRAADLRRPGAAPVQRGADRAHAGRRSRRRRRRDRRPAGGRHVLRLHGAGRHPGDAQPPQEGPAVRGRRAPPAAGRAVRRGRRRAPGRRRLAARRRPRLSRVPPVRAAQRARAARRDRVGLLLRRQRGAARLLRRRHRDRGLEHRDGRPGDDRGRRARRPRARRRRPDRRAVRKRRRRPARRGRGRGGRRRQALPVVLPRRERARGRPATSARCAT